MDLLISDCDGVLVDSEVIALRVVERELVSRLPGVDVSALVENTAGMTTAAILEQVQRLSGRELPASTLGELKEAVDQALDEGLEPLTGARQALDAIAALKAVASNSGSRRLRHSLERAGLAAVFGERVFSADAVPSPKPAPDLYFHVARTLAVDPARCLVVEDSVTGVTAARRAGMTVIGFTGASHPVPGDQPERLRQAGAVRIIEHMDLLADLVNSWETRDV